MRFARTLAFTLAFYVWAGSLSILMAVLFMAPRSWTMAIFRFGARGIIVLLRLLAGVRVELRGREHMPNGRALIAAKHQSMFDVFAQFAWLPDASFVMRKELMRIPFFNVSAWKAGMVVVDRDGGTGALRELLRLARDRLSTPRQLVIFPEGHRGKPGEAGDYHPGVAGLYRDLELPCHLIATNSGVHWPNILHPRPAGTIVFEYLPPIDAGLKRGEFMRRLESEIEAASNALIDL